MAFYHFACSKVDIAVIETGLGGRLDSTNIIRSILSVITNIGLDHKDVLGPDIKSIAKEKAGIIKLNTPVLIGEFQENVFGIFKNTSNKHRSNLFVSNNLLTTKILKSRPSTVEVSTNKPEYTKYYIHLNQWVSNFLVKNIQTSLATILVLRNSLNIKTSSCIKGVENVVINTKFFGRGMLVQNKPKIILDSAHNIDGITSLLKSLELSTFKTIRIIYGVSSDKDVSDILRILPSHATFYWCNSNTIRALPSKTLKAMAEKHQLFGKAYSNIHDAYFAAKSDANDYDLIVVFGSIFILGELFDATDVKRI